MAEIKTFLGLTKHKIRFTTLEGEYEGIVKLVCPVTKRIIVEKIVFLPENADMGVLYFGANEILKYNVTKLPDFTQVEPEHRPQKICQPKKTDLLEEDEEIENTPDTDLCENELSEDTYTFPLPSQFDKMISSDSAIISKLDETFCFAIENINNQPVIGLTLESPKIDRFGSITWLNISTPSCTYLFDIEALKETAFDEGLRSVLSSPEIEKVTYDCRKVSDCLFHLFKVKLAYVFDIQVADMFVNLQSNNKSKKDVVLNSLDHCLQRYLEIPQEHLHVRKPRSHVLETVFYGIRPIQKDLRNKIMKNVIYLPLLYKTLKEEMFSPFRSMMNVFLDSVKTLSDQELLLEPSKDDLPSQLGLENIQIVKFNDLTNFSSLMIEQKLSKDVSSAKLYSSDTENKSKTSSKDNIYLQNRSRGHSDSSIYCGISEDTEERKENGLSMVEKYRKLLATKKNSISSSSVSVSSKSSSLDSSRVTSSENLNETPVDIFLPASFRTLPSSKVSSSSISSAASQLGEDVWETLREVCAPDYGSFNAAPISKTRLLPAGKLRQ